MAEVVNTKVVHDGEVVADVGDPVSKLHDLDKEEVDALRASGGIVDKKELEAEEAETEEVTSAPVDETAKAEHKGAGKAQAK